MRTLRLSSPSLVVAMLALLLALSGTGFAAQQIVPLAKRALVAADKAKVALNARALAGKTPSALVQQAALLPGPASTAAELVTVKSEADGQIAAGAGQVFTISCAAGQKIVSAGFASDGPVIVPVSLPATMPGRWACSTRVIRRQPT